MGALGEALTFIINALLSLFTYAVILRFLLQVFRADFYNPLSQAIVQITDPALKPMRMVFRPIGGIDIASLVLAFLIQVVLLFVIFGSRMTPLVAVMGASFRLPVIFLDLYFFLLIVMVILSWVAPGTPHPAARLIHQLTEPVVAPVRRIVPPMGGLDFSVLFVFLLLTVLSNILMPAFLNELGLGFVLMVR